MKIPRNRVVKKGKIEIIPMIDVMFFLVATMIMASLAMQKYYGIPVNLTSGQTQSISIDNEENITISITHDNEIYINKKMVKMIEIEDYLKQISQNKDHVIIASDAEARHKIVTKVMVYAKRAGVKKFSIITKD